MGVLSPVQQLSPNEQLQELRAYARRRQISAEARRHAREMLKSAAEGNKL
jgi:hypothetical protein